MIQNMEYLGYRAFPWNKIFLQLCLRDIYLKYLPNFMSVQSWILKFINKTISFWLPLKMSLEPCTQDF